MRFGFEHGSRPDLNLGLGFLVFFGDCESGSVAPLGRAGQLGGRPRLERSGGWCPTLEECAVRLEGVRSVCVMDFIWWEVAVSVVSGD